MAQITLLEARMRFKERLFLSLGMRRKPLKLFCEHCGKFIPSDMPWRCGFCDTENYKTKLYSFLYKCGRCKQPPKSFICPHCEKRLPLAKKSSDQHPARKIQGFVNIDSAADRQAIQVRDRNLRKQELEHDIVMTRLNAELNLLKKQTEPKKEKTPLENLEQSFSEHDAHVMAVHKIVKREKEANAKEFANDAELREMADESVDDWAAKIDAKSFSRYSQPE
jgi:hypothetical protein